MMFLRKGLWECSHTQALRSHVIKGNYLQVTYKARICILDQFLLMWLVFIWETNNFCLNFNIVKARMTSTPTATHYCPFKLDRFTLGISASFRRAFAKKIHPCISTNITIRCSSSSEFIPLICFLQLFTDYFIWIRGVSTHFISSHGTDIYFRHTTFIKPFWPAM